MRQPVDAMPAKVLHGIAIEVGECRVAAIGMRHCSKASAVGGLRPLAQAGPTPLHVPAVFDLRSCEGFRTPPQRSRSRLCGPESGTLRKSAPRR